MPHNKSTLKRLITSKKKHIKNRSEKSAIKTVEKKFFGAIESSNLEEAKALLAKYFKQVDKAAKRNVIHQNKANRKKSQLAKLCAAAAK